MKKNMKRFSAAILACIMVFPLAACGKKETSDNNLIQQQKESKKVVNMFTPMEKSNLNADNAARTAQEQTVIMAEEQLGMTVEYRTYTAENYQEKT